VSSIVAPFFIFSKEGFGMNEHDKCEHVLQYCKICDIVYCDKCNKEWIMKITYIQYPTTWIGTETVPYTITVSGHTHGKDLA
jgi:hypothetical protein